jgi:hypothetical protein
MPYNLLEGRGLLCCKQAGAQSQADRSRLRAADVYSEKVAALGRVVPLEDYKGSGTKILHRCLTHNEEHLAIPNVILRGCGLICCKESGQLTGCMKQRDAAAAVYKQRLAEIGKVVLLGEYVNAKTKALHRCLLHNEEHYSTPDPLLKGHGLKCCKLGGDNIERFLNDPEWASSPCKIYVATVNGSYLKPGIAKDEIHRADDFYSGFVFVSETMPRIVAWEIEQQILLESKAAKPRELPIEYEGWYGRSELRLKEVLPSDWYIERINELLLEKNTPAYA